MKTFALALVQSILTAVYWWLVTTISFGLFGGSRNPAAPPPSDTQVMAETALTIVVAIVVYALLLMSCRRIFQRKI